MDIPVLVRYLYYRYGDNRVTKIVNRVIFWSLPPLILFQLFRKLDNNGLVIMIGLLWLVGIAIYVTSQYLYDHDVLYRFFSVDK